MRTYALWSRVAVLAALIGVILIALSTAVQLYWVRGAELAPQVQAAVTAVGNSTQAEDIQRRVVILGLLLAALALPMSWLLARAVLRPWVQLRASLALRRAGGAELSVPEGAPPELVELIELIGLGSAHARQNAELRAELQALHAATRQGVFRTDAGGVVLDINQALADVLGGSRKSIVEGRRFDPLLAFDRQAMHEPTAATAGERPAQKNASRDAGESDAAAALERARQPTTAAIGPSDAATAVHSRFMRLTRLDKQQRSAVVRVVPIRVGDRLIGHTGTVEDVSERLGSAENRRMLAAIVEHGADLIVVIDRHGRISYANRAAREFWGMVPEAAAADDNLLRYLTPAHSASLIDVALPAAQTDGGWIGEDHITGIEGTSVPVAQRLIAGRLTDDDARSYALVMRDLSLEWAAEQSHNEREKRLRTIVEAIPALVAYVDPRERFRFANRAYRDWLGLDPARMIGSTLREQYGPDVYQRLGEPLRPAFDGDVVEYECALESLNYVKEVHVIALPDRDVNGRIIGVHVMVHDITAKRLEERRLLKLTLCDPQTGLPDRNGFDDAFDEAVMRADATDGWLGLLRVDIDGLRRVEVDAGEAAAETVLREFGARLRAAVRRSDLVCRLASDGFAIILDAIGQPVDAAVVADKVVDVMRVPFFAANQSLRLSINIGVATYGHSARSAPAEILAQAEVALQQARRAGRDQVVIADADADSASTTR